MHARQDMGRGQITVKVLLPLRASQAEVEGSSVLQALLGREARGTDRPRCCLSGILPVSVHGGSVQAFTYLSSRSRG